MANPPAVTQLSASPMSNEQHHADDGDRGVLPVEVGLGAGLDGRRDVLHARIARRQLENGHHREHAVQNGDYASANRQPQPRRGNHAELLTEIRYLVVLRECRARARHPKRARTITNVSSDRPTAIQDMTT